MQTYSKTKSLHVWSLFSTKKQDISNDNNIDGKEEKDWIAVENTEVEVIQSNNDDDDDEEEEWMSDREKAKRKRELLESIHIPSTTTSAKKKTSKSRVATATTSTTIATSTTQTSKPSTTPSPYTEEEEEVIRAMGGKDKNKKSTFNKREPGFLGDCTLEEIATDYSVPVCYLADVLCMWGTPVPIDVHTRLGDMVTGEQAFAILEAINSLDVAALHDRYSNQSLMLLCEDWDIPLSEAFEMAMKEGWSLPFGVQTVLRVEQEEELIRVLGSYAP